MLYFLHATIHNKKYFYIFKTLLIFDIIQISSSTIFLVTIDHQYTI